ncbi:Golgi reassembly stacking protein 2 [Favolaschia claudopus]|uniref:Golgi reassembly stacking protein 2 n=1 Tax=Favolaschia claudopus TaxID=2862362 RepID=A0AAW0D601_9AGAR
MGATQSTQTATPPSRALHVLRVTPDSPGLQDKIVEGHEGRTLNLLVWNAKSQGTRVVPIVPSRTWSLPSIGSSPEDAAAQPSLLGLSMRICEPEFAMDNVWHVLDVLEGSPAESAGLVPYGDYITGWSGGVLSAENDFYELVEAHVDKPLLVLVPNRHWGGEGLLGCVFGYGLLHRIPPQPTERSATPPELLENVDEYEEQQLFVPADIPTPQPQYHTRSEDDQMYRPTPVAPILEEEAHDHAHDHGHGFEHVHHHHHHHHHDHDHDHDHGDHNHDEHSHNHEHAHSHPSPPGPPRRTSSLTASSSLRSSRVPTPVFSAAGRVPSSNYGLKQASNSDDGTDGETSAADDDTDRGSLTSHKLRINLDQLPARSGNGKSLVNNLKLNLRLTALKIAHRSYGQMG